MGRQAGQPDAPCRWLTWPLPPFPSLAGAAHLCRPSPPPAARAPRSLRRQRHRPSTAPPPPLLSCAQDADDLPLEEYCLGIESICLDFLKRSPFK